MIMLVSLLAVVSLVVRATCIPTDMGSANFTKSQKVMGYYPAYHSSLQSPAQIPWSLYTDVTFFVAIPELDGSFTYPPGLTSETAEALAGQFVKEATANKVLPIMSYGGWTGSKHFSIMVQDDTNRQKYARVLIDFAKKFGFKGIDLDWEYPNAAGIGCNNFTAADTVHFGSFVRELRKQWPEAQYSAALSIGGLLGADGKVAGANETQLLVENLDFANIMAYDVFGNWAATTGPIAPIYDSCAPENPASINSALAIFTKQGFKPSQMVLGIPAYARSYELTSPKLTPRTEEKLVSYYYQNHTTTAPQGGKTDDPPMIDVCGVQTNWAGIWLVNELMEKGDLSADQLSGGNGYTRHFDECSGQPFLTNGKYFFSYDDQVSIAAKGKFAKKANLAGIFFFDTLGQPQSAIKAGKESLQ
ncbi:family 18 glycoside hydrolase [Melampsora larici-populina 98AG31]|uniref:Family 18 glycoside hydrolase n=1 Tax=Melampsora larici-populina (strain 98AG31 / pathotype 3-4-7) TaxID=747676 RepID=F4S364_MELLP|nr:family 18 glycoside hydrolase [Melampsora larici-populina 98AG31]EGG00963.1 family 18 glycoside hydrolase [Melampsora larici-populina 98AG31]